MALEIHLPPLGESISEATIVRWLKEPGDTIARDEDHDLIRAFSLSRFERMTLVGEKGAASVGH